MELYIQLRSREIVPRLQVLTQYELTVIQQSRHDFMHMCHDISSGSRKLLITKSCHDAQTTCHEFHIFFNFNFESNINIVYSHNRTQSFFPCFVFYLGLIIEIDHVIYVKSEKGLCKIKITYSNLVIYDSYYF